VLHWTKNRKSRSPGCQWGRAKRHHNWPKIPIFRAIPLA
jgi:hypothetical protein